MARHFDALKGVEGIVGAATGKVENAEGRRVVSIRRASWRPALGHRTEGALQVRRLSPSHTLVLPGLKEALQSFLAVICSRAICLVGAGAALTATMPPAKDDVRTDPVADVFPAP